MVELRQPIRLTRPIASCHEEAFLELLRSAALLQRDFTHLQQRLGHLPSPDRVDWVRLLTAARRTQEGETSTAQTIRDTEGASVD